MPLLDSFTVDHTRTGAPAVRMAEAMNTPYGDAIAVSDLCSCMPNEEVMPERGIRTLERLFAGLMRSHLDGNGAEIANISPMGCRTGLHMNLTGTPDEQRVVDAWEATMEDVPKVQDQNQIPRLNVCQCGTYQIHSLQGVQNIAHNVLECDVRINSNEELAPPEEKLRELHIQSVNYLHNQLKEASSNELTWLYLACTASVAARIKWRFSKPY